MAVIVAKRHESNVQFIDTARELFEFSLTHCVRFPKRYKEFISIPIVDYARRIYEKVKSANTIFATLPCEFDLRITLLDEALGLLYTLTTMVDIIHIANIREVQEYKQGGKSEIKDSTWQGFAELIDKEINLVKAIRSKDKELYKKTHK